MINWSLNPFAGFSMNEMFNPAKRCFFYEVTRRVEEGIWIKVSE
jgi:hypothetical protein